MNLAFVGITLILNSEYFYVLKDLCVKMLQTSNSLYSLPCNFFIFVLKTNYLKEEQLIMEINDAGDANYYTFVDVFYTT